MLLRHTVHQWYQAVVRWLAGNPIDLSALPAPKRYRRQASRMPCPGCGREVAYSPTTNRTARHQCGNMVQQVRLP